MKKVGGTKVTRRETLLQSALKNGSGPQNELQAAWDSLGKAKSILRQVDHKMTDISKPSSADILWHLPDFLYCLVDQENLKDLPNSRSKDPSYLLSNNVNASPFKRKVSYKESRVDTENHYDSISNERKHSSTDGSFLPTSDENSYAKDIPNISSISALSSNFRPQSSAWNNASSRDVTADVTSSTALRDTDIRFLNDVAVQLKSPKPREAARPPRFHHVDVVLPAGYGRKKTAPVQGRKVTIQDPPDDGRHFEERLQEAERDDVPSGHVNAMVSKNYKSAGETAISGQFQLDDGVVIVRKVATGPPAPTHRGFNEPQSRFRASPVKAKWVDDEQLSLRGVKDNEEPATQTKNTDVISEHLFLSTADSARKRGRVTGTGNSEVAKKEIITTASWRAGAKLTHDLGLTFTLAPKSEAASGKSDAAKESKKTMEKMKSDQRLLEGDSLPDLAKKILQDLQSEKESAEEKKKMPKKKLFKKKAWPSEDEIPKEKLTKVVLYDANKAREFIRKQKEQRRKDRTLKKEAETKMKMEKQQRLEELGKRQHDAAVKSMRKTSANATINRTWDDGMTANNAQSAEEEEEEEDDDDGSSEEYSNASEMLDNTDRSLKKRRPEMKFEVTPQQQSQRIKVFDEKHVPEELGNSIYRGNTDGPMADDDADDDDLTAQEIVNRFAIKSGLTLQDVVSNYAKYADEIMRSFIAKDDNGNRSMVARQKEDEGSTGRPKPSSASARLEAILHSSKSLQSRLNTETQRFATDPVMSSGANVRTGRKTPNDYISDSEKASPSTSAVFVSNLPGSNHRPVMDSPTLTQAHPAVFSSAFVYHVQQSDMTVEQQEAIFKNELSKCDDSKKESCPFYLRPPLGQLTNKLDNPLLIAAKLVPSWNPSVTEADPLSILNIFSRRQKGTLMMNVNDSKISGKPSKQKHDSSNEAKASKSSTNHKKMVANDDDTLSLIPERDTSTSGRRNLSPVRPTERIHVEKIRIDDAEDGNSDNASSVPPVFPSHRSDPWPVTPRSEVMTNRSDGVSYTMDFTDDANVTDDDENNRSDDHFDDRSVDQSVDHSVDHSGGWSGSKGGDDQFVGKERAEDDDEAGALATNSEISSLTASDPLKEDDSDFSNVTSVTLDSALLTQQSKPLGHIQHLLPLFGSALANQVLAPVELEARMLAELNLLDNMDEALHQVNSMERTRAVALAQQETVALAQVLKARQQSQNQEVEAARVKLEKENVDESRRLHSRLADAADREHNAAVTRIQTTADAIASLQDAMHRLTQTQADAAQMTADAAMRLAEASAIALEKQEDRPEMGRLLTESATAAASAAVIVVMQQLQLQTQQRHASGKERKTSISSESPRKSSKHSHHHHRPSSSARSDRSVKSERSGSYRTAASSAQTSEYDSGSDTATIKSKRSRKTSSIFTEPGFEVGMDLSRPTSARSVAADSDIQTASDMSKVSRKSRVSVVTDLVSGRTKSVASDMSSEENSLGASSITTELSVRRARSTGSRTSKATEQVQSERDYASDYDSATEDELDKSLREILPSESQRKQLKKNELKLNLSSESDDKTSTNGASSHRQSPGNNSFDRFNVAMVQQYLKEEAVRHQHKQMLLQLREKALKEKTAAELAWLEQQKQTLKKKGLDDKYPELSKKQNAILRKHKKYQEELNRLKAANQMTLESQKLLLNETRGVNKLQKSVQQVKRRLKNAGAEGSLPDLDITTDDDDSNSIVLPQDETDAPGKGDEVKSYEKDYETNETLKKSDRKRLIEHEERLQKKITRFEKLLQDSPKQHRKDLESKQNQRVGGKKRVSPSPRPLDSARSVGTASDALTSARTGTARSNRLGSISEDLASARNGGRLSAAASVTDEVSTARSVNTVRSSSQDDSSADVKEDVSEAGNKNGSSDDESNRSVAEQLSRRNSIASNRQKKSERDESPRASKSTPENRRRNESKQEKKTTKTKIVESGSDDDDFTLSQSVDVSDQSEIVGRIENLTKELKSRKKEAEQLKRKQEKKRLKLEEDKLKRKLKDYDSFIKEAKKDLQKSPTSSAEEPKEQTKSVSRHSSNSSSDSSTVAHSTTVQDISSNKPKTSELPPLRNVSGRRKSGDDDDRSQVNTRRSSMSEDIVIEEEDLSVGSSLSAGGGEKVLLDLDLGVLLLDNQSNQGASLTPRSARSDARIPESARTLADIPEDYSLDDLNRSERSQTEPSEKAPSRSVRSQGSDLPGSYTADFSETSTSVGDGPDKRSADDSELSHSDRKSGSAAELSHGEGGKVDGSAKVAEEEEGNKSTDEDITEELLSVSGSEDEDEQVEEMKIVKDNPLPSDANMELQQGSTNSSKDNGPSAVEAPSAVEVPSAAEAIISDKEVLKKVNYEEVTKTTLDMLLKETIDELVKIKKQKQNANSATTKVETISPQQSPRKPTPYSAANEKEDFLDDDKYSFGNEDVGAWNIPTKLENNAVIYERSPAAVEPPVVATVVPHNKEEVLAVVNSAVDLLWNNQNPPQPPPTSWDNTKDEAATRINRSDDVTTAQSKASYSRLIFDMTAEAVCSIYMDEETAEKLPWCVPKVTKGTRHYVKPSGVTAEHVKPTVQERVLGWLGLDEQNSSRPRPVKKFRRRRGCQATKSDQLDELVLEDLHEEEGGWVDYSQDELNIKMELADNIFDTMLRETVSLLTTLKSKE